MANTNTGISNFIYSQAPFFARNDHPNFIKFVEAYYEYLEQEGKTINRAKGFREALDVDRTIDLYTEKLYSQFLKLIPEETIADRNLILKHVKDFYRARGTEKSISFLMAILYDLETEFYYPKRDILKASDGKWYQEKSLKVYDITVDDTPDDGTYTAKNFTGRQIRGLKSNATATVESVDVYYETGVIVKELKISNQVRDFSAGETIEAVFEENGTLKNIKANVFSGIIVRVDITNRGKNYVVGDTPPIESANGSGGVVIVSSVSKAALKTVSTINGGAGFQVNNPILVSGGGGSGANVNISEVNTDETVHPNSYNIVSSTISLEAGTKIGNSKYSNLNSSLSDPANSGIGNSMSYFVYANTGPIQSVIVNLGGNNYTGSVSLDAQANTRVKNLGILGRMEIIDGGSGYAANDEIEFINQLYAPEGAGVGARGYVANVNGTGSIVSVRFKQVPGYITGGSGYSMRYLPRANVISSGGVGANIAVTAILGDGESLVSTSDEIGAILELKILSGGSGYKEAPTINLKANGSGTAQATATIVQGVYTYPGRYLNDDGHLSSHNFLQDGRYYHNYSYVVRIKQAISNYRKALKDLIHPAGMSLFGEYMTIDNADAQNTTLAVESTRKTMFNLAKYSSAISGNNSNVTITYTTHGLSNGNTVYLEFQTGDTINISNGIYTVTKLNTNSFRITQSNAVTSSGNVFFGVIQ